VRILTARQKLPDDTHVRDSEIPDWFLNFKQRQINRSSHLSPPQAQQATGALGSFAAGSFVIICCIPVLSRTWSRSEPQALSAAIGPGAAGGGRGGGWGCIRIMAPIAPHRHCHCPGLGTGAVGAPLAVERVGVPSWAYKLVGGRVLFICCLQIFGPGPVLGLLVDDHRRQTCFA
jgi:hypothetical protein